MEQIFPFYMEKKIRVLARSFNKGSTVDCRLAGLIRWLNKSLENWLFFLYCKVQNLKKIAL